MADKISFALRLDEDLFKALEKWAADDFRSVNGQLEWIIHQKLKEAGRLKEHGKGSGGKMEQKNKKG